MLCIASDDGCSNKGIEAGVNYYIIIFIICISLGNHAAPGTFHALIRWITWARIWQHLFPVLMRRECSYQLPGGVVKYNVVACVHAWLRAPSQTTIKLPTPKSTSLPKIYQTWPRILSVRRPGVCSMRLWYMFGRVEVSVYAATIATLNVVVLLVCTEIVF